MKSQLCKTPEGRERLEGWYARFLAKVDRPVEAVSVPTRFGESHVLITGPEDGPPLVVLHAMRTGAAFLLAELPPLLSRYRVYAPDMPGQSIRGLDVRLPFKGDAWRGWIGDVFDGLRLDKANLFGVSWGGYVARVAASSMPSRVERLALLVPAGIANGSHLTGLMKMAFPMLRYQFRPTQKNLRQLLAPIVSTWYDDWGGYIECSLKDLKMDPRIPPVATVAELKQLTMPVLAITGEDDISFPGQLIARRLKAEVPQAEVEVLPQCKHCPPTTPEFREWIANRLMNFFG